MTILRDVLSELFKMFVSDARLTASLLVLVLIVWVMIAATPLPPLAGGGVLVLGSLAILMASVRRAARRRAHAPHTSPARTSPE